MSLLTAKQVASRLACSERHVRKLARDEVLASVAIGEAGTTRQHVRFTEQAVRDFIAARSTTHGTESTDGPLDVETFCRRRQNRVVYELKDGNARLRVEVGPAGISLHTGLGPSARTMEIRSPLEAIKLAQALLAALAGENL